MAYGINYTGSAKNDSTSGGSTIAVTYSPTKGNIAFVFVGLQNTSAPSCTVADSASNSLTALAVNPVTVSTTWLYGFQYVVPSTGITGFTASITSGLETGIICLEYSVTGGTMQVLAASTPSATGTATSSAPTISSTLQFANDWLIVALDSRSSSETSWSSGNLRVDVTAATARVSGGDNTASTATSVTCTGSTSIADWCAIAGEIKFIPFLAVVDNDYCFDFTQTQGFLSLAVAESDYGDNVEGYFPGAVFTAWDNDADFQQNRNVLFTDQIYEGAEVNAPTQANDNTWDDPTDNQINPAILLTPNIYYSSLYNIDGDTSDTGVENLPYLFSATDIILMGYKGYSSLTALKDHGSDWTQYIVPTSVISDYTWDNDTEHQIRLTNYYQFDINVSDESVEKITALFDAARYDDFSYQTQWAGWNQEGDVSDSTVEKITAIFDASYYDDSNQVNQLPFSWLIDSGVELIIIPILDYTWDDPADNQVPNSLWSSLPYQIDVDTNDNQVELLPYLYAASDSILMGYRGYGIPSSSKDHGADWVNYVVPVAVADNTWDNDAEQQKMQLDWDVEKEVIDTSLELVQPAHVFDDTDNQRQQLPYQLNDNFLEDKNVYFIAPIVFDTDSENQLLQTCYQTDHDLLDSGIELVQPARAFDGDVENQIQWLGFTFDHDVPDPNTEISLPVVVWDVDFDSKLWIDYYKDHLSEEYIEYFIAPIAYDFDTNQLLQALWSVDSLDERDIYPIIPAQEIDNDAEQQFAQPGYYRDDFENTDREFSPIIPVIAYDNDSDNQKLQLQWNLDVVDERPEQLYIPIIAYDNDADNQILQVLWNFDVLDERNELPVIFAVYDNDADQQLLQLSYVLDKDLSDSSVEFIQPSSFYDSAAENQIQQLPYNLDRDVSDSATELVQPYRAWDNDAENQIFQLPYNLDIDVVDTRVELVQVAYFFDTDTDQQLLQLAWYQDRDVADPNIELVEAASAWDNDADSQLLQSLYNVDKTVIDEAVERVQYASGIIVGYDTDTENQLQWLGYYKDHLSDENVEKITIPPVVNLLYAYDNDAENQLQWIPNFGQDDVLDSGVELVQVSTGASKVFDDNQDYPWRDWVRDDIEPAALLVIVDFTWDNTAEQQIQQLAGYLDVVDERNEFPIIPVSVWDTVDVENQRLQDGYNLDRDIVDSGVELVQAAKAYDTDSEHQLIWLPYQLNDNFLEEKSEFFIAPIVYDTDAENQKLQDAYTPDKEVSDAGIELVENAFAFDTDAESQLLQLGYQLDKDVLESNVVYFIAPIVYDTDSENQKLQDSYNLDRELLDSGVEKITYASGIIIGWDTDADQQKLQIPSFSSDTVADENVEKITLPPIVATYTWDDFAEQSFLQLGYYKDHLSDEGTEIIILPLIAYEADFSLYTGTQFSSDTLSDEGVEKISVPSVIDYTWDNDADQQFAVALRVSDFDIAENRAILVILPPFIDIVEIVGEEEE